MKVIISAAGTGGHINPGIAIANKIKQENPKSEIMFIGTVRGLENDLVPRAGYKLKTIDAYGFSRKISISNVKKLYRTLKSIKQAKQIIYNFKPDIVIGTGGYICGPVFIASNKYNIPTILHESNAFPGVTVKMLARKTNTILVAFKDAKDRLNKFKNVVVTGTPTKVKRLSLSKEKINSIKRNLGFDCDKPLVLIFGGSQGAQSINNSLIEIIKKKLNIGYQIMWACGPKQYDIIKEDLEKVHININNIKNIKIIPYIYNMEEVMNVVDLLVCRSGAMTITEISTVGKPAIFIPFPFATENHQEYNARVLEKVGAATIILDKDLNANVLNTKINELIKNPDKLIDMGDNARKIYISDVENNIYKEIKKLLNNI